LQGNCIQSRENAEVFLTEKLKAWPSSSECLRQRQMSDQKFEKILKRIYTITLGREINQGLFLKLNEEQTSWVIQAAANVIIADGEIDSGEFEVMQDIIQYLDNQAQLMQFLDSIRKMEEFPLQELNVDQDIASDIYFFLANIAYVGGLMTQQEARLFPNFARLLKLDTTYCKSIIQWAQKQSELNQKWIKEQGDLHNERKKLNTNPVTR
jgi:tellurite resistance protein|tara:strand:- start:19 stop:648 length:630 start_codon:yes stop_codon:yes gene_type:complete